MITPPTSCPFRCGGPSSQRFQFFRISISLGVPRSCAPPSPDRRRPFGLFDLCVGRVVQIVDVLVGETGQALVVVLKTAPRLRICSSRSRRSSRSRGAAGIAGSLGRRRHRRCRMVSANPTVPYGLRSPARRPVEFLANVIGNALVQSGFGIGELIADRVCRRSGTAASRRT